MNDEKPIRPISRTNAVVRKSGPELKVIRLKGGQVMNCIVLSDHLHGFEIHWDHASRRSEPHMEDEATCEGCLGKKPRYWKYYLHVWSTHHAQCFVELTQEASEQLTSLLEAEETYRGVPLEIKRTSANNGRLFVAMSNSLAQRAHLPVGKDPEPTLRLLWRWGRK